MQFRYATLLACAALIAPSSSFAQALKVGSKAPALKVGAWVKGQPVKGFADGKVHVVEFWATWCGPCKTSIPHITDLAKKYAGKVTVTGVSVWETPAGQTDPTVPKRVEAFVNEMGDKMAYNVARDDNAGTMAKTWMEASNSNGIPTAFIVGKDGTVQWIGHPMEMDGPLERIVAGKFDMKAEAAKKEAEQREQARRAELFRPIIKAMEAGDHKLVVEEMDKVFAKDRKVEKDLGVVRFQALMQFDQAKGLAYAKELSEGLLKADAMALNEMAWFLVDEPTAPKEPDHALALAIAEKAVALTKGEEAATLDTLAVAQFRAGKIDAAIATQEKAITVGTKAKVPAEMLKEFRDRLEKFKKAKG